MQKNERKENGFPDALSIGGLEGLDGRLICPWRNPLRPFLALGQTLGG